ncbi:MAG: hypothetical protein ABJ111_04305, partial [Alphaproteobacteria bacterium]
AFSTGTTILNDHVMEHFAVADRPANQARLAALVAKNLETFTLDLCGVSDSCGHAWAYPPPVESFLSIPGPHWPRLSGYVALGGPNNAEAHQPRRTSTTAAGVGAGECRQSGNTGRCRFGRVLRYWTLSWACRGNAMVPPMAYHGITTASHGVA